MIRHLLSANLLLLLLFSTPSPAVEIVNSVKPLQLISLAITEGATPPQQLLPASGSPHDYQLRPSDMRRLSRADVVFWIGPDLERFLVSVKNTVPSRVQWVELGELVTDEHHPTRGHIDEEQVQAHRHGPTSQHDVSHQEPATAGDHHDHGGRDPHLWMSPELALLIAEQMTEQLATIDPKQASLYRANLKRFGTRLAALEKKLERQLKPLQQYGYFVFHDAYGYFERHFGLNHLGAFTLNPDRRPGAKRLLAIRGQLQQSQAKCVFTEPQFKPAIVNALTEGLDISSGELDPIAASVPATADGYFQFLQQLANAYSHCLSR